MAKRKPTQHPTQQFFMLTPNVRDKLLECKLTASEWRIWCYLVSLDPFGDRGAKFSPAELMLKCGIKKTAYFKAKAKFQQLGLFDFKDGVTKVINLQGYSNNSVKTEYCQQEKVNESANAESQSANAENQSLKTVPDKQQGDPQTLQTLQTFQTPQTGEGKEKKVFSREDQGDSQETAKESKFTNLGDELLNFSEKKLSEKNSGKDKISAQPVASTQKNQLEKATLTTELEEQLLSLEIPLDQTVRKCIEEHHISQVQKALAHIENTWSDIRNPRSVFLYQVPRQKIEKPLKNPLTPEFREWYNEAIAQGLVVNRHPETLPLDRFREPLVFLPDGRQVEWTKVRDGKVEELMSPQKSAQFLAEIRAKLAKLREEG